VLQFEQFAGFQWDEGNIDKNLHKLGVENWKCEQIFFNEPLIILEDPKHSLSEKRWAAFGKTDTDRLLTVIFARRGRLLRVISARDMNRRERKYYEEIG
jgi:uncharacterized DUF497 family protein